MPDDAPVLSLSNAEVLDRARRGALPPRFRVEVESASLAPTVPRGAWVTVAPGAVRPGALVCVARAGRLVWRRVIDARGGELLLRAEVAPFADGWFSGALGAIERPRGARDAIARRAPAAWTSAAWRAALLAAHARHHARRARARLAGGRGAGASLAARPLATGPERTVIGLFDAGELVGETTLAVTDEGGFSGGTRVDPAHRGRGGGALLLVAAVAEARRRGLARVRGYVDARNVPSLAACRAAGLLPTGRWWRDERDPFRAAELQWLEVEARLR